MKTLAEYEREALRTAPYTSGDRDAIINFAFGLVGEAGEVVDHLKKYLFHGDASWEWEQQLILELGDLLWYIVAMADQFYVTLETVAAMNIAKLRKRYPNGFVRNRNAIEYIPTQEEIDAIKAELATEPPMELSFDVDADTVIECDEDDVDEDEMSYYKDDEPDIYLVEDDVANEEFYEDEMGKDEVIYDLPYPAEEDYWKTH